MMILKVMEVIKNFTCLQP